MSANDLLTRAVANVIPKALAESKLKTGKPIRLYWGIDPTGSRIHLGHAVPLRKLKAFADAGHEVIIVIGSFTAMVGDPSGRDEQRTTLTKEDVEKNFTTYKEQAAKIIDFAKVKIRYNHEWLEKLTLADLLPIASNFTVQQMLERDMFEKRMESGKPIHVHEFFYPLMVGYDSVVLDVDCELGGSDQEFNMLAGRTLQKAFGKREKFVLTTKLLEGTDGRKMSKTYDNCVYLDDEPKDMFGKLMSVNDELIVTYFEYCTDTPMAEIAAMEKAMRQGANPKEYKVRLAHAITALYHGAEAADHAKAEFENVFAKGALPEDMLDITVQKGTPLLDVLAEHKLIASKGEGRRLIEQKAVSMNDVVVTKIDAVAEAGVVKVGKRRFVRISF